MWFLPDPFPRKLAEWLGLRALPDARLLGEAGWVTLGQALVALGGLISVRVVTEFATADVIGEASLLVGLLSLGRNIFVAPVFNSMIRFYPAYAQEGLGRWAQRRFFSVGWAATSVFLSLACVSWLVLPGRWSPSPAVAGALIVLALVDAWRAQWTSLLSARREQRLLAILGGGEAWVALPLFIVILSRRPTTSAYLLTLALAGLIPLASMRAVNRRSSVAEENAPPSAAARDEFWQRVRSYGAPFATLALLGWLSSLGERYVLVMMTNAAAVGVYSIGSAIASRFPAMIGGVLNGALRPVLFEAVSQSARGRARATFRMWLTCAIVIAMAWVVAVVLGGRLLSVLLLAKGYRTQTEPLLPLFAVASGLVLVAQVLENGLYAAQQSHRAVSPQMVGASTGVLSAVVLIPSLGLMGAVVAKVLGAGAQLGMTAWALRNARFH